VVVAKDDDEKCRNDFQTFLACVKTEYQKKPASEKAAEKQERRDKANKCFADASCDAPDWDKDPMGGGGKQHMGGMQMPPAVKECLKKKLIAKIGVKLNECLSKKGVKGVNFTALADSLSGSGLMEGHGDGGKDAKDGLHAGFSAKFNEVKGVDKCAKKKGGDTDSVKPLEQCLHNIKKDERPKMCALIKPCQDKITGPCKQRSEEVYKTLCQCKKEKEKEISGKLRTLGHSQAKVGIQDLVKTVADDQDVQDIMQQVDNCYQEANEPEPPLLKLAMKMFSGGGGRGGAGGKFGAAFSVDGSTVVIMGDMMALDAEDQSDCKPCA